MALYIGVFRMRERGTRGSGGRKSFSVVQWRSPDSGLGDKVQEYLNFDVMEEKTAKFHQKLGSAEGDQVQGPPRKYVPGSLEVLAISSASHNIRGISLFVNQFQRGSLTFDHPT